MANIYRKSYTKDNKGILRPTRKQIPVADRRGVAKASQRSSRLDQLKNKGKPIATLAHVPKDGQVKVCIQRRLGGIGDVIMTTPLAEAFKQQYPNCEFTYATQPGVLMDILKGNPYIDKVVDYNTINQLDYHLFADVTSTGLSYEKSTNPPKNRIDMFAEYVGVRLANYKPTYIVSSHEKAWAQQILTKWFNQPKAYKLVYLDISSVDQRRSWPAEYSLKLINEIGALRNDIRFVINDFNRRLGHDWNYQYCQDISSYGIRESAAILEQCDLFVGPDSGMLHIAGALEKNIIGIFGSTPAAARINHYQNAVSIENTGLSCLGCWYKACHINYACMTGVKPASVRDLVLAKLDDHKPITNSLLNIPINIYTVTPADNEVHTLANSLRAGMLSLGLNASLNNSSSHSDSIVFEIVKTSLLKHSEYSTLPTGKLKVGYLLIEESQLSREAFKRLAKGYDLLLTNSRYGVQIAAQGGLLQPIYYAGLPLNRQIKPSQPSQNSIILGAIVTNLQRSNYDLLLETFRMNKDKYQNLKLRILSFDQSVNSNDPRIEIIHSNQESSSQYESFWFDLNIFVDCTINTSGLYMKEAMLRGLPVVGIVNNYTQDIPSGLFYGMTGKEIEHVYYSETESRHGNGYTVDADQLYNAISDVVESYSEQVQLTPSAREWILKNSSQVQLNMIVNFLSQKLANT